MYSDPIIPAGKVWIVGAGPGDPELLTLKAVKALGCADVVLADDLVSDEVLAYARRGARIVHVGKRGGCASTPQSFIEKMMTSEARAGRTVVRLKGGDPFVFGRGGEECDALRAAGVDFEVVNGITSGLAAATAAGVPLTHRDACHGVMFVTGHEREGTTVDWPALARTGLTLVIYMGIARVDEIRSGLLAGGLSPDTPAIAVQNATRSDERTVATTLHALAGDLQASAIRSPAILVIGEVVRAESDRRSDAVQAAARFMGTSAPGHQTRRRSAPS